MIADLTRWILEAIRQHGAWSVFLGVLIEQIIVPIPSPAIIMGAGFLLVPAEAGWGQGLAETLLEIVLPGALASTLGAVLIYAATAWGGKAFVDRFERWLDFGWKDVESFGARLRGPKAWATVFLMRALPVMPLSLITMAGGALRLPLGPFVLWTFLGSLPRCLILGILGWKMGSGAWELARGVNRVESAATLAVAGACVAAIVLIRRRLRRAA
jgi:membrane protein DedA with SNARE-associated domain